jgi:four helix bundle protein
MEFSRARNFQTLLVWKKAQEFVLRIYRYTANFPKSEMYGLASQMRRAAVSIPTNIAEAFKKASKADKVRMMNIGQGSIEECRYYLILSQDIGHGETRA